MALTYEPITYSTVVGSGVTTLDLTSIPSTYTDLRLVVVATSTNAEFIRFNSDTSTVYSRTRLYADGSTVASTSVTGATYINMYNSLSSSIPSLWIIDIFNYAGSTFKSVLYVEDTDRNGSGGVEVGVGMWRSTSAITSINLGLTGAASFGVGTTVALYGIKAA